MATKLKTITEKGYTVDVYRGTGDKKYKVVIHVGNSHRTV